MSTPGFVGFLDFVGYSVGGAAKPAHGRTFVAGRKTQYIRMLLAAEQQRSVLSEKTKAELLAKAEARKKAELTALAKAAEINRRQKQLAFAFYTVLLTEL